MSFTTLTTLQVDLQIPQEISREESDLIKKALREAGPTDLVRKAVFAVLKRYGIQEHVRVLIRAGESRSEPTPPWEVPERGRGRRSS